MKTAPGRSQVVRVNAMSFCRMIKLLQTAPISYDALSEKTGLHLKTVAKWVCEMRRQDLVHIGGWRKNKTGFKALWSWGFAIDADKPKKSRIVVLGERAEYMRALRERKRKEAKR